MSYKQAVTSLSFSLHWSLKSILQPLSSLLVTPNACALGQGCSKETIMGYDENNMKLGVGKDPPPDPAQLERFGLHRVWVGL